MHEAAERLAKSLLFEGYALYPYTPQATKNATPTPFGIAYPPAYAGAQPAAFDHVRVEVVATASDERRDRGRGAVPAGGGTAPSGRGAPRAARPVEVGSLLEEPLESSFVHEARAEEASSPERRPGPTPTS